MGPYVFGKVSAQPDVNSNRSFFCLRGVKTISSQSPIFLNAGEIPHSDVIPNNFGQIDFVLIAQNGLSLVEDVCADQRYPLA